MGEDNGEDPKGDVDLAVGCSSSKSKCVKMSRMRGKLRVVPC